MACGESHGNAPNVAAAAAGATSDAHSYSNPHEVRVTHVDLDLEAHFDRKVLQGTAALAFERARPEAGALILDTRALDIAKAEDSPDGTTWTETKFDLGPPDKILGSALIVLLRPAATSVRLTYATRPEASGLQWLDASMTAGKQYPYLFSQSEAIHARSWIPIQDSPQVRVTYADTIRTPPSLVAVMSAASKSGPGRTGVYRFEMPQRIPPYLIALAVGDLAFAPLSARTGVWAEPSVLPRAAAEFVDTEKMMQAAEKLFGPYRWERYDILVLPPSFPFGGMENPRLTFATPTILAGDRSLVSLVAHELAHSWSGNLVTNATWRDLWLNEGFTTYIERRLQEEVFGKEREEMEAVLGRQDLEGELARFEPRDQILHIDLSRRDPDDAATRVPYEKGALFLRLLEETFGRAEFDVFLRGYFDAFAFRSIQTGDFVAYLKANLLDRYPEKAAAIPAALIDEWIEKPGLPAGAPRPASQAFARVEAQARDWQNGRVPAGKLDTKTWSTQEWLRFLRTAPSPLSLDRMRELDRDFRLTASENVEIAFQWLLMAIAARYEPADARLAEFLRGIGRRKFIKPLYEELCKTPEGQARALAIYRQARPDYHPIARETVDRIVGWKP
ncbi:MAG: M1 family metallopeptidase [Thermoanaerobaculia bacterium]